MSRLTKPFLQPSAAGEVLKVFYGFIVEYSSSVVDTILLCRSRVVILFSEWTGLSM